MTSRPLPRPGVTLLELLVALVVLGIAALMVAPASRSGPGEPESVASPAAALSELKREAIRTGRPQHRDLRLTESGELLPLDDLRRGSRVLRARAYPDGSIVADSGLGVARIDSTVAPAGEPR